MSLLPEIGPNGEFVYSKDDLLLKQRYDKNFIAPERKAKFKEELERIKAKHLEKDLQEVDEKMGDLNNMGHKKVTPDFEDSPHADRQPIVVEEDVVEAEEDEEEEKEDENES